MNQNVKMLRRRLYSPSEKHVAWLEDAQESFLTFLTFFCKIWLGRWTSSRRGSREKNILQTNVRATDLPADARFSKLRPGFIMHRFFFILFNRRKVNGRLTLS